MISVPNNSDSESSDSMEDIQLKPVQPKPHPARLVNTEVRRNVFTPVTQGHEIPRQISELSLTRNNYMNERNVNVQMNHDHGDRTFPPVIPLNVGGIKYITRLSTLRKYEDSMLAAMFSGRHIVDKDEYGNYFLDSNGQVFANILDFLRNGTIPPNEVAVSVFKDANYFGLHELVEQLQFKPDIAAMHVKEAHRQLFPNYFAVKQNIVKIAMDHAITSRTGEIIINMFKTEFAPKAPNFNPKHGCVAELAHIKVGPWEGDTDEEMFIRCLENDYLEEGFNLKPHETKRKCRYYHGQTCPKFTYKLTFIF